jgi:septal ring factor EnvC (AmiA/AmiB activator)
MGQGTSVKTGFREKARIFSAVFFFPLFFSSLPLAAQEARPTPAAADPGLIKNNLLQNKKGLAVIQKKLKEEKQKQQQSKIKEKKILNRLHRVDQALGHLEREKEANEEDLQETKAHLENLQADNQSNQVQVARSRELLKRRLRALYRMSFRTPFWGGLFDSESFGDFARKLKFGTLLAESNGKLLEQTLRHEGELRQSSLEWGDEQKRKERLLAVLGRKEKNYSREKNNRTGSLDSIRKQQAAREQKIAELNEAAQGLQQKVSSFLKQAREAQTRPAYVPAGAGLTVKRGKIPWPVSGRIISPYGKYRNPEFNAVVENTGIQIQAPLGTPFRAVAAGTVRYADWFKGYGKLVILDHGKGYYSLYAQASELSVSEGQAVAAGQILGNVGDTGSLVGSSLYFEIRKDAVPQDPLRWLKRQS